MTACFKLAKLLQQQPRVDGETVCSPCVYYSRNLDRTEYPVLRRKEDQCGLGFLPGDSDCGEMRTDNCSAGKNKA